MIACLPRLCPLLAVGQPGLSEPRIASQIPSQAGLLLLSAAAFMPAARPPTRCCAPLMAADRGDGRRGDGRRSSRVAGLVRSELASVIRSGDVHGATRIPGGLQQLISVVDVDMSPDLRNARVKVSVIGERKDKVSAVRWLQGNSHGIRYELAQRLSYLQRVPRLSFAHVDVGAATNMMVKLGQLRREREGAERARGEAPADSADEEGGALRYELGDGEEDEDVWEFGDTAE